MLKQHQYYVYHEAEKIYARRGEDERVLAETAANPQEAYRKVQKIVNPKGLSAGDLDEEQTDKDGNVLTVNVGFHQKEFQAAISDNCREYVVAAYAKEKK